MQLEKTYMQTKSGKQKITKQGHIAKRKTEENTKNIHGTKNAKKCSQTNLRGHVSFMIIFGIFPGPRFWWLHFPNVFFVCIMLMSGFLLEWWEKGGTFVESKKKDKQSSWESKVPPPKLPPPINTERLVVGCGFCTFGDPLNLQLVRIVQSRTHSKPFMSHSHASASCTPLSSVHFTTAPSEKKTRENQKKQKNQRFGN